MRLSQEKRKKIKEQILSLLYNSFPKQLFTAGIASEIARDEEFVKNIMIDLKFKNLVVAIRKNNQGIPFIRRMRWQLTPQVYTAYQRAGGSATFSS